VVQRISSLRVAAANGKFYVSVPVRDAEGWQTRLRRAGVRSTVVVDPLDSIAQLELWPGADPAKAQAVLDGLRG
jgi:hypothetical protein